MHWPRLKQDPRRERRDPEAGWWTHLSQICSFNLKNHNNIHSRKGKLSSAGQSDFNGLTFPEELMGKLLTKKT